MTFELNLSPAAFTPQAPATTTAGRAFVDVPDGTALLTLAAADTPEALSLVFALPSNYAGGTITARLATTMASATAGNLKLNLQVRRMNALDDRAFAAVQTATIARGTDPKNIEPLEITFTAAQIDGAVAGDDIQLRLTRDNAVGSNAAGNARVIAMRLSEA